MEIGSIFEINPLDISSNQGNEIPELPIAKRDHLFAQYFNTGRTAIEALLRRLKQQGCQNIWLPSFLCDSVRDAAVRAQMKLQFYRVETDLSVDITTIRAVEKDIVYVVQFFGKRINNDFLELIKKLKSRRIIVIEDISLSLLSYDYGFVGFGDYIIGSLRKWFPITDGGILLSHKEEMDYELADASNNYTINYFIAQILKDYYLKNGKKEDIKEIFLSYNDEGIHCLFQDYTLRSISRISTDLLRGLDYKKIQETRIDNYDYLNDLLNNIPQLKVLVDRHGTMTPLGMVILSEDRDALLKFLISKDIYCNVHWRNNQSTINYEASEYLAARCITIPCDQRYGHREMDYIFDTIRKFYRG